MKSEVYFIFVCPFFTSLNFGQDRVDYSAEWRTGKNESFGVEYKKSQLLTSKICRFDLSNFWLSKERSADGILGTTYEPIQFFITQTQKCNDSIYQVKGKNRIKGLVSKFEGTIKVTSVFNESYMDCDNGGEEDCKTVLVIAECRFEEPSDQKSSGVFTGVMQTHLDFIPKQNTLTFNEGTTISDKYYQNNTFVGVWKSNKSGIKKKCVFGDYALPWEFLEDFRKYYGGVTSKYRKNGWDTYGVYDDKNQTMVDNLDKWWL